MKHLLGIGVVIFAAFGAQAARADAIDQYSIAFSGTGSSLPTGVSFLADAVSYEYFGFNFVSNSVTSSTVGTLFYTGDPGCGGTCVATTQLGSDPSVSLNVNEVVYENTAGGGATSELGYYVEYQNPTPGTYAVTLHAPESLSIADGASNAFAYLAFGMADGAPATFNPFTSYTLQEADCVNYGCNYIPVAGVTPAPFAADHLVQMVANTPYFVLLDVQINPSPTGVPLLASIDPQFSTDAAGGSFAYSSGVTDVNSTPEPGTLVLMLPVVALLGGLRRCG
jgi:hypothetical protein